MLGNSLIIPSTISSNSCSEMSAYLCPEQRFHTHGFFVLRYFTHIEHRCDLPRCKFHVQKKLKLVPGNEVATSSPLAKVHNLCPRRHIGVATIDLIAVGDQQSCSLMKKVQNCFSRRNIVHITNHNTLQPIKTKLY